MNSKLYRKVEKFVVDSCVGSGRKRIAKHLTRTAFWVGELKPDADEAMYIAAVSHDIERVKSKRNVDKKEKKSFLDEELLRMHQKKGAEIIAEFLNKQKASKELIDRVVMLVEKHEIGGNNDQNIIKDADSISFFENNIDYFVEVKVEANGKDRVKEKFDWMFNRINSKEAKEIAREWYKEGLESLKRK